jgi:[FeFe] hydrogenase H-cluster maturation GTPase HydF
MAKENKPHIGIFGRVNAGKSTLLNFITHSAAAITSPVGGTTTDPVRRSYEIAGFSPVILIDTPGVDDTSALGVERARRTGGSTREVDLALIVFREWSGAEDRLAALFRQSGVPFISVRNIFSGDDASGDHADISIDLSSPATSDHTALMDLVRGRLPGRSRVAERMFGDMLAPEDHIVLVCPVDAGAPAGRMILPQMQALREVLDAHATAHVVQPGELAALLDRLAATAIVPRMVVADSQVYRSVREAVPATVEVSTFSILLAAAKGDYEFYLKGLERVRELRNGDGVLVCEFCSHQISCDDIARVKIPALMRSFTGRELKFTYMAPGDPLPENAADHALMLLCGGCMATRTQVRGRIAQAREAHLPATNFGMLLRLMSEKS